MKRDDFHPWFTGKQLTRPPGNFCLYCGERLSVRPEGEWNFLFMRINCGKRVLLGYVHNFDCTDEQRV